MIERSKNRNPSCFPSLGAGGCVVLRLFIDVNWFGFQVPDLLNEASIHPRHPGSLPCLLGQGYRQHIFRSWCGAASD